MIKKTALDGINGDMTLTSGKTTYLKMRKRMEKVEEKQITRVLSLIRDSTDHLSRINCENRIDERGISGERKYIFTSSRKGRIGKKRETRGK